MLRLPRKRQSAALEESFIDRISDATFFLFGRQARVQFVFVMAKNSKM
jgi:hypothetical protein